MIPVLLSSMTLAQEAPPIVGGSTTSDHTQVGVIIAVYGQQGFDFCSGTLIQSKWATTAAHCIEAMDKYDSYGYDFYFVTGTDVYDDNGWFDYAKVSQFIAHPQYNSNTLSHDIGLIELQTSMSSSGTYPVNTDSPGTFSASAKITFVGWGITGDNRNDSGVKRTVDIDIYGYDSQFVYTYDAAGQTNICSGDSGGAALLKDGSSYKLVGVNSFTTNLNGGQALCEGSGAAAGATRVDANYDWIASYVDFGEDTGSGGDDGSSGGDDGSSGGDDGSSGGDDGSSGDDTTGDDGGDDTGATEVPTAPGSGGSGDEGDSLGALLGCSSVPAQPAGLFALAVMGLALLRRRDAASRDCS